MMATSVEVLLKSAEQMLNCEKRSRERESLEFAPGFNPVQFFGHRETLLSRVIAWMLDEGGSHGQRRAFLTTFIERFSSPETVTPFHLEACLQTKCAVEVATSRNTDDKDRRIDILVSGQNLRVAIENKPYAGWQWGQLPSYWTAISHCRSVLIAFVGYGQDAQVEVRRHWEEDFDGVPPPPFPGEHLIRGFGYKDLANWINDCAALARPPSVRQFLHQFAGFCQSVASGGLSVSQDQAIVELINKSSESLDAARAIEVSMKSARAALAANLAQELQKALPNWSVTSDNVCSESCAGVRLSRSGVTGCVDFYLYGPLNCRPWVVVPNTLSSGYVPDRPENLGRKPAWWRWLDHEDLGGVEPKEIHKIPSSECASRLSSIALACERSTA